MYNTFITVWKGRDKAYKQDHNGIVRVIMDCQEMVFPPKQSGKTTINRILKDGILALHDPGYYAKTCEPQLPPALS